MFRRGDLVRIKSAEGPWSHMVGKIGIFIREDEGVGLSQIIRPVNCTFTLKFDKEDLEYLCHGDDINKIFGEENI